MRRRRALMAVAVVLAAVTAGVAWQHGRTAPPVVTGTSHRPRPFAPDSVWNTPVPRDARIAPDSAAVVRELTRQAMLGTTFNTDRYSVPVYTVPAGAPTVVVRDADDGFMSDAPPPYGWGRVPLPAGARPAAGTDRHLVVWQPSTDTMWEFWEYRTGPDGPSASAGARIPHVSRSPGWLPAPYGATATGLPVFAGVVTAEDAARGRIDHALALAVTEPRSGVFVAPATRTDGFSARPDTPAEGSRLRLDPAVDVDALDLPPLVAMLAHAAQTYGVIVRDRAGGVVMYGEDPAGVGFDPFARLIGDADRSALMRAFPWDRLQLLAP